MYCINIPIAYIYDIGIRPNQQGQGLGKVLLIAKECEFCKQNNFEDAYVEAASDYQVYYFIDIH